MKTFIGLYMVLLSFNNNEIKGTVYDEHNEIVPGAKITTMCDSMYTDFDGNFAIPYSDKVKVSMISYQDVEFVVDTTKGKCKLIIED